MSIQSRLVQVLRAHLRQALRRRQLDEASAVLERLRQEDPLSVATRGLELEYLLDSRRWDEAGALAEQLLRFFPGSARIHYLSGRLCYQRKDYPAALRNFQESARIHPNWHIRRWLGKTHSQLGELPEAEALLLDLIGDHPAALLDLGWVYERMDDLALALDCLERYLKLYPDDALARAQRLRLRARALDPEELIAEVETLEGLGQAIPSEMLTAYVERLLEMGQGSAVRRLIDTLGEGLDRRTAASLGWVCHHLRAYDLALRLFLVGLPDRLGEVKYLSALESDAARCGRLEEVIAHYGGYTSQEGRLYGRIKILEKRLHRPGQGRQA